MTSGTLRFQEKEYKAKDTAPSSTAGTKVNVTDKSTKMMLY
jgi:hypothetical protein